MSVGRNDPCPCASGRKYKKCHLPLDDAARPVVAEEVRSALHDLDDRFVDRVLGWAVRRFGDEADPDALEWSFPEVAEGGMELLLPWAVYHHTVEGLPPFEWYARENEPMLSRREREWIEAQRRSWLSIWEVRESVPGKSMLLADLLTGEQRLVQEAGASRVLAVRDAILGRESIVAGRHWRSLPPLEVAEVIDRMRRRFRAKLPLGIDRLRDEDTVHALIARWHDAVDDMDEMRHRRREHTCDVHPLRLIVDRYRFIEESRGAVEAALASIAGASAAEAQDEGTSAVIFHKDDVIVGTAFVSPVGELHLESDSLRRAAALRRKVEKACRGLLTAHRRAETDPLEKLLDEGAFVEAADFDDSGCP